MKELSIEEKAKRYDEAIIRAKSLIGDTIIEESGQHIAEVIFPELKESEDEKIKNLIYCLIRDRSDNRNLLEYNGVTVEQALAWLEKQGEQKETLCDKCKKTQPSHSCQDITALGRCALEKQGEYKPADKVEPKFKIGDWVVRGSTIAQILDIKEQYYIGLDINGKDFTSSRFLDDDKIHLWTIQDAKDGDVLSYRDGQWIFIYKEKIDDSSFKYYTLYSTIHQDLTINDAGFTLLCDAITPATKEQRDTLMKAMADAGCTFDFEKKELKKIEQKPAWSEEDEKEIAVLEAYIRSNDWSERHIDRALGIVDELVNKVKSLRPQNTWKPSDEQMSALSKAIAFVFDSNSDVKHSLESLYNELKKL